MEVLHCVFALGKESRAIVGASLETATEVMVHLDARVGTGVDAWPDDPQVGEGDLC